MRLSFCIRSFAFALACSFFIILPQSAAMPQPESLPTKTAQQALARLEKTLTRSDIGLQESNAFMAQGEQCLSVGQKEMEQLAQALTTLGPPAKDEAPTVSRERHTLATRQAALEKRLGECRLLTVKAKALTESLLGLRRQHLAQRLLEEVAINHPLIISDTTAPKPQAFFIEFGDSSLNFELRCFIHDVDQIFVVRSDLNFAIDAAFRANHVQIPFPQRDLHVIDLPRQPPAGQQENKES